MKITTAKKIKGIWKYKNGWEKAGSGYVFRNSSVYLTIGETEGMPLHVNIDTIQAKTLDDCATQPIADAHYHTTKNIVQGEPIHLGSHILEALKRAVKVISQDSPRNYGTVALIHLEENTVKVVATDSFMIYRHSEDVSPFVNTVPFNFRLGVSEIKTILTFFDKETPAFAITADNSTIILTSGNKIAHIRTSAIKYPNYKPVMPDLFKCAVSAWPKDLPKVKGAISAIIDPSEATYFDKNGTNLGKVKIAARDLATSVYNPRYLDFVNDCPTDVHIWQNVENPSYEPSVFTSRQSSTLAETIVIVPIVYKPEELQKMRA
jgi:hypothetical protein